MPAVLLLYVLELEFILGTVDAVGEFNLYQCITFYEVILSSDSAE